jgi:post-segregation antitoxin (ccd killing protein)
LSNKIRKTVSFNITNEKDRKYLERIKDINFSGYVKELIEKDIQSTQAKTIHKSNSGGIKIVIGER